MIFSIFEILSRYILLIIEWGGHWGIFVLMALESANIPIPSEIIMPFAGFLAASKVFNFWLAVLIGAFGNLAGSLFSYWLGYLTRKGIFYWNNHKVSVEVERARAWLDRFGDYAIFISRLLPVVRTFISFPIGVLKTKSLWKFSALTFAGSFIWSAFLAYLGLILGENWQILHVYFRRFDYLILIFIAGGGIWWIWRHIRNSKIDLSAGENIKK